MEIEVVVESKQIFENKIESEKNICKGIINYYRNGAILEFTEKYEKEKLEFKLTILGKKILIDRSGQKMTLDLENEDNVKYKTPFGIIYMNIKTKRIDILKQEEKIQRIELEYEIKTEDDMRYTNIVNIDINDF